MFGGCFGSLIIATNNLFYWSRFKTATELFGLEVSIFAERGFWKLDNSIDIAIGLTVSNKQYSHGFLV